jgi:hypothetical protein
VGITSNIDSGNRDLNGFYFDGTAGHHQGPGGSADGQVLTDMWGAIDFWKLSNGVVGGSGQMQGYGAGYFSAPLGIPMVGSDGGNALTIGTTISASQLQNDYFYAYSDATTVATDSFGSEEIEWFGPLRGLVVGGYWYSWFANESGRWSMNWSSSPWGTNGYVGFRCALTP